MENTQSLRRTSIISIRTLKTSTKKKRQAVNKNEISFLGRLLVYTDYISKPARLPQVITLKCNITPLLSVNWLDRLPITTNKISSDKEKNRPENIYTTFASYSKQTTAPKMHIRKCIKTRDVILNNRKLEQNRITFKMM